MRKFNLKTNEENLNKWRYDNHTVIDTTDIVCPFCHGLQRDEYVIMGLNIYSGHPSIMCEICLYTFEVN